MSKGTVCQCHGPKKDRMKNWEVVQRNCNHSAFSGYHYTPSAYSELHCKVCGFYWRTKANYVYQIPNKNS